MLVAYIDDSGKDATTDPSLVLAAWVARCEDWEPFSDEWFKTLKAEQALRVINGEQYFRHSDMRARTKCFTEFSDYEAAFKTVNLARLVFGLPMLGFAVTVPHDLHTRVIKDRAIRKRGKLKAEMADPFYVAFLHLIPLIQTTYYNAGVKDKIDFITDGNDKALRKCINAFREAKQEFTDNPWFPYLGYMCSGDDKELAPLQAADMLAGQVRLYTKYGEDGAPILSLWSRWGKVTPVQPVSEESLNLWKERFNIDIATETLAKIVNEREANNENKTGKRVRKVRQGNERPTSGSAQRTTKKTRRGKPSKGAKKKAR